jgi:hypothetical protein
MNFFADGVIGIKNCKYMCFELLYFCLWSRYTRLGVSLPENGNRAGIRNVTLL